MPACSLAFSLFSAMGNPLIFPFCVRSNVTVRWLFLLMRALRSTPSFEKGKVPHVPWSALKEAL